MWLLKRKQFDGQVFATFMILYGIERYLIEFRAETWGRGEVLAEL
jgi:prolipoprotein diacylglyceryltransferase